MDRLPLFSIYCLSFVINIVQQCFVRSLYNDHVFTNFSVVYFIPTEPTVYLSYFCLTFDPLYTSSFDHAYELQPYIPTVVQWKDFEGCDGQFTSSCRGFMRPIPSLNSDSIV